MSSTFKSAADQLMRRLNAIGGSRFFSSNGSKQPRWLLYTGLGLAALAGWAAWDLSDTRSFIHRHITMPLLHAFTSAEFAHRFSILSAAMGLTPKDRVPDDESLALECWGRKFSNPVGLAAGYDKQGEAISSLFDYGYAYVEVGSVTPEPQPGNERPRFWRLKEDRAVVNHYGCNSHGHDVVLGRLKKRIHNFLARRSSDLARKFDKDPESYVDPAVLGVPRSLYPRKQLAINVGKNKNGDETEDFLKGVRKFGNFADILVVNVSCPNISGVCNLQSKDTLVPLLNKVVAERNKLVSPQPPIVVKIGPDLTEAEISDIAHALVETKVDGVIVCNSTGTRPKTLTPNKNLENVGGISGPVMKPFSLRVLRLLRKDLPKEFPIIGCGGITSGKDAVEFARAGATMIQIYTAMTYEGPAAIRKIKDEIVEELNGKRWVDIIGTESA
ncbi:dihydroorotate dehydrogenase Ura3 [Schizosaccharomyces japonicus yFS275]|uniref:Dihydroorotate dehydrogenase (quinone), mitochondrial n=1 Tax=Schizosaccharomyces japonicus (strain yFS275 / FY16936) TaxID=402676 RepID=B6JXQ5_SCHJY|nr:dihydroorotate dehydrogenase Ura3 [Schizosaccharomyces japonicus yFS275]EEB05199.1 dihydroorotate dehydrogenase Ura3 [Schizosaccharomyces japonicus yFS275]